MTHATLALRATQQTALTPRLQQSVRLLQLSSQEFAQELEQALATNPFLDVPAQDQSASGDEDPYRSATTFESTSDPMDRDSFVESIVVEATIAGGADAASVDQRHDGVEMSEGSGSDGAMDATSDGRGDELYDFASFGERSGLRDGEDGDGGWSEPVETLRMHLHDALVGHRLSRRDQALTELVIEALDDDGYLRQELDDAARCFDFDPPAEPAELVAALELVQHLGPAGIAARSVSECLTLQLDALAVDDTVDEDEGHCHAVLLAVAQAMVREHIDRIASRDWAGIRRCIGCTIEEVADAAELIRGLDPRPGSAFGGDLAQTVVPDVIVRRLRSGWHTDINPAVIPRLCLNRVYAALYHDSRGGDRQPLGQQLQEARWLLRNAAQRFVTIRRVARVIVAEQAAFLDYGDIALKPLLLRQVADQLELHESTISRAIGNKFMATPRGVFAFKHFFSRKLATVSGGSCSATSIRAAMREFIEREDCAEPMSDVELARRLTEQGLCVARRTVTKYRGQMRIPPVEMRRRADAGPMRRSGVAL